MSIFNSLGSNYSWRFAFSNLFSHGSKKAEDNLKTMLGDYYGGKEVTLTYKGREALELALQQSGLPQNSVIGINGFTCYVVYRAVEDAGYRPVFIDTAQNQLNFGLSELRTTHTEYPQIKAVIIQNTLGYPADITAIESYCHRTGILIIEDLAHSLGAVYEDSREAGTVGAFTMLSFSQDKPLDVVAGGALVDRRTESIQEKSRLPDVSSVFRWRSRTYPLWTNIIRATYGVGIGRLLHFGLKRLHLLATPMNDKLHGIHRMNKNTTAMLLTRWQKRTSELNHRRDIATIYKKELPSELMCVTQFFGQPVFLRFPLLIENREGFIKYLKQFGIYTGDTWYDAPIAPKRYLQMTNYRSGQCPNAEKLTELIVNLPTHQEVTPSIARDICVKIKQWQVLPQK